VDIAIILGSSRNDGNTHKLVKLFMQHRSADLFNLCDYSISGFDYEHKNKKDDFLGIVKKLSQYDHLIFASPVYWYSMSAPMKTFFDRLSDLLTIEKNLGRALKGKSCSILCTGSGTELPNSFVTPFELTANYLGMTFSDALYCACKQDFTTHEHIDQVTAYLNTHFS
jgi:multimeric flavodoxin WrbA